MTIDKLNKMCCPFDKDDLDLKIFKEDEIQVVEGLFTCSTCKRYYPIIAGIPIMVPDEFREHSFEKGFLERWAEQIPTLTNDFRVKIHKQLEADEKEV